MDTYYSCPECHGCGRGEADTEYVCSDCGCAVEHDEIAAASGFYPTAENGGIELTEAS